jgi:hypothetical protein
LGDHGIVVDLDAVGDHLAGDVLSHELELHLFELFLSLTAATSRPAMDPSGTITKNIHQ